MPVVAGVDSSTQSTTVVLHDLDSGAVLGTGHCVHPATFPPLSEQHPSAWWTALSAALHQSREAAGLKRDDITAISVAAQCHGLVALDDADQVIRPAKLWNDTTSAAHAERLQHLLGTATWVHRVGSLPPPAFTIAKVAWLADEEPENYRRMARIALPHDWLTFQLTGALVTDRSDASGTGYYSASRGRYDLDILAMIDRGRDWEPALPVVLRADQAAGTIQPRVAEELGLSAKAVVGAGSGDQHAGAVGLGVRHGDLVFVFGTSGVVYGLSASEVLDETGAVNCVADATTGYQPLVCTLNAAKVTDTIARILGVSHDELSELALSAPRRPDRTVLVAYFDGERTPDRPHARGMLAGLSNVTSRCDVALAAFEGVILGLNAGRRRLEEIGVQMSGRVIATGGGAHSRAYVQVLADTLGRDVATVPVAEPVAAGAAIQAAALLAGEPIAQVRDAWAQQPLTVAKPQTPADPGLIDRYTRIAAWEGLEQ